MASPAEWDVQTVGSGFRVRKGQGGIVQGSVLLAQSAVGCKKGSQLLLVRVVLLLQLSFQLH